MREVEWMKNLTMTACLLLIFAGCANPKAQGVPAEQDLLASASVLGKYEVTIERYDVKKRIAVVRTPGWKPETKPYQFDGKRWVPLWSPFEPPAVDIQKKAK